MDKNNNKNLDIIGYTYIENNGKLEIAYGGGSVFYFLFPNKTVPFQYKKLQELVKNKQIIITNQQKYNKIIAGINPNTGETKTEYADGTKKSTIQQVYEDLRALEEDENTNNEEETNQPISNKTKETISTVIATPTQQSPSSAVYTVFGEPERIINNKKLQPEQKTKQNNNTTPAPQENKTQPEIQQPNTNFSGDIQDHITKPEETQPKENTSSQEKQKKQKQSTIKIALITGIIILSLIFTLIGIISGSLLKGTLSTPALPSQSQQQQQNNNNNKTPTNNNNQTPKTSTTNLGNTTPEKTQLIQAFLEDLQLAYIDGNKEKISQMIDLQYISKQLGKSYLTHVWSLQPGPKTTPLKNQVYSTYSNLIIQEELTAAENKQLSRSIFGGTLTSINKLSNTVYACTTTGYKHQQLTYIFEQLPNGGWGITQIKDPNTYITNTSQGLDQLNNDPQ